METIKNNHNYTVQIIHVLTHTFFKSYISKICNDYIYIYI